MGDVAGGREVTSVEVMLSDADDRHSPDVPSTSLVVVACCSTTSDAVTYTHADSVYDIEI